jgi:hypothetical protein
MKQLPDIRIKIPAKQDSRKQQQPFTEKTIRAAKIGVSHTEKTRRTSQDCHQNIVNKDYQG